MIEALIAKSGVLDTRDVVKESKVTDGRVLGPVVLLKSASRPMAVFWKPVLLL